MKILCDRHQLLEAFAFVGGIPPQKTPKPILQNVLCRAEDTSLTLFATDGEMSAKVTIDSVKVSTPGTVLLPAREMAELLRELGEPTLTLSSEEFRCTIESGSGSYVLLGENPAEFPAEPALDEQLTIDVAVSPFVDMVRRTSFAAAREETRYAINGLLLDHSEGQLRLVGTDGRRLALCYLHLDSEGEDRRVVVPIRALQAFAKAMPEDDEAQLRITIGKTQVGFTVGAHQLVSQLLDNRFPEYEQVIPKAADTTVEINRQLLERTVRRVRVLSSDDVRMVRFEFSNSTLKVSAESSGVGRGDDNLEVTLQGPGGGISFNPDYLLDALKVSDLEVVRMDMTDESTPAKFTLGEAYTYILMPISGS